VLTSSIIPERRLLPDRSLVLRKASRTELAAPPIEARHGAAYRIVERTPFYDNLNVAARLDSALWDQIVWDRLLARGFHELTRRWPAPE
jgi:hypothetical protein